MLVGYARVSSVGQSLDVQLEALQAAGCEKIFSEKRSGTSAVDRAELDAALSFVREGDTLVVTRLDRLARSAGDLHNIVRQLTSKGVASIAEFEADIRRERQREGIERAKVAGVYKGRKPSVDAIAVQQLKEEGLGGTEIAKQLGIGRASVYRALQSK